MILRFSDSNLSVDPTVTSSLSGIPFCHRERKQLRGLRQEQFPRDARVHEEIQRPSNAGRNTSPEVGMFPYTLLCKR